MKRRKFIMLIATVVIAVVAAIAFWPGEQEPEYQGKKLSEWVFINARTRVDLGDKAAEDAQVAIRNIGTNALPFLIKAIKSKDPSFKIKVVSLFYSCWNRLPDSITTRAPLIEYDDFVTWYAPVQAFGVLRDIAGPAIPELAQIARSNSSNAVRARAVTCLWSIGPNAASALTSITTNNTLQMDVRLEAVAGLGIIGRSATVTISNLISLLHSEEPPLRTAAASALGAMGVPVADLAVPPLIAKLDDDDVQVRIAAARALANFQGWALDAEPMLTRMLDNKDARIREAAEFTLERITSGKSAAPLNARDQASEVRGQE